MKNTKSIFYSNITIFSDTTEEEECRTDNKFIGFVHKNEHLEINRLLEEAEKTKIVPYELQLIDNYVSSIKKNTDPSRKFDNYTNQDNLSSGFFYIEEEKNMTDRSKMNHLNTEI